MPLQAILATPRQRQRRLLTQTETNLRGDVTMQSSITRAVTAHSMPSTGPERKREGQSPNASKNAFTTTGTMKTQSIREGYATAWKALAVAVAAAYASSAAADVAYYSPPAAL